MRQQAIAKELAIPRSDAAVHSKEKSASYKSLRRRWMTLLLGSLSAAAATGLSGIAFAAASYFHLVEFGRFAILDSILIAAAFTSLIFGAHCLDRIDAADHAARVTKLKEKISFDLV